MSSVSSVDENGNVNSVSELADFGELGFDPLVGRRCQYNQLNAMIQQVFHLICSYPPRYSELIVFRVYISGICSHKLNCVVYASVAISSH